MVDAEDDYDLDAFEDTDDVQYFVPRSSKDEFLHLYESGAMCEDCSATREEFTDIASECGVHPIGRCSTCGADVCPVCVEASRFWDFIDGEWVDVENCRSCATQRGSVLED